MKIGIIPKIISRYTKQIEISVEINLVSFFKSIFRSSEIIILKDKKKIKMDLIIISGGNELVKFSSKKKDIIRYGLDNYYFGKYFGKVPIIGICHGAQFLASKFKNKIIKKKSSTRRHKIFIKNKNYFVNSYHDNFIKKIDNIFEVCGTTSDGYIEYFLSKKNKLMGIMWHPEREIIKNKIDINLVKKFYANSNSSLGKRETYK